MPDPAVLMVAPNGARRGKADHPALPVTISETVDEAERAFAAGATVLHAHVRDAHGRHVLDTGLYRELIAEMRARVPDMLVQVTTEAVGRYTPQEQADCLFAVRPDMVSIALREMAPPAKQDHARDVFARARAEEIHLQHILYDAADLRRFLQLRRSGIVPEGPAALLFVLGRYADGGHGAPEDLAAFLDVPFGTDDNWTVCAFGPGESACIAAALAQGGHARVGFENNLHVRDGALAESNADLVREAAEAARAAGRAVASPEAARNLLGLPLA